MAYNLFINAAARDPKTALCISLANTTPIAPPTLVLSDTPSFNVYITDGAGGYDSASTTGSFSLGIGPVQGAPSGGTFTLTSGANTTSALAYNLSAAALSTALNLLASITAEGGVTVSGTAPIFTIDWVTVGNKAAISGSATNLTPDSAVVASTVRAGTGAVTERQIIRLTRQPAALQTAWSSITNGRNAVLSLATQGMIDLVNTQPDEDTILEAQHTDANSNVRTILQVPIKIRGEVIDEQSMIPTPVTAYLTATEINAQMVQNRSTLTGLTGGGSTNLDGIVTASGAAATGWMVCVDISGNIFHFELVSGTDAESSPYVIRPDDYAASTNEVVWKLRAPNINNLTADASPDGAADYVMTYDASATAVKKVLLNNLPTSAGGEANTASNVGAGGTGLFKQKTGVNLEFRNINAGSNQITVTLDAANNEVDIDVAEANIKLDDLGTPDDNADLNASTTRHGLLRKLDNSATSFLNGTGAWAKEKAEIIIAASDETTAITAGSSKVTFRMPRAMTLSEVRASLTTAQASGTIFTVDINESGTSVLSTKLTIDNTERTSTSAATAAVISDSTLADDAEITVDVDSLGDGTAKGLKVMLLGTWS